MAYVYIIDTKLFAYRQHQRGGSPYDVFNVLAEWLITYPKGEVIFAADKSSSSYRLAEQPHYKGNRCKSMTAEEMAAHTIFTGAYHKMIELAGHLNVKTMAIAGVEADDIASIITEQYNKTRPADKIIYFTADRDWCYNVIGTRHEIHTPEGERLDAEYVEREYGVTTKEDWVLLKSIAGDAGDNLKGPVKYFGAVKVKELLDRTTDLEEIAKELNVFLETESRACIPHVHERFNGDIVEIIKSNMKIAEPFTDFSKLTDGQKDAFLQQIRIKPTPNLDAFDDKAWMYNINLSKNARRVYA